MFTMLYISTKFTIFILYSPKDEGSHSLCVFTDFNKVMCSVCMNTLNGTKDSKLITVLNLLFKGLS